MYYREKKTQAIIYGAICFVILCIPFNAVETSVGDISRSSCCGPPASSTVDRSVPAKVSGPTACSTVDRRILARVNGIEITTNHLFRMFLDQQSCPKGNVQSINKGIEELIDQELLLQASIKAGYTKVQSQINVDKKAVSSCCPEKVPEKTGLSGLQKFKQEVIFKDIDVTDADLLSYYETHLTECLFPKRIRLRSIKLTTAAEGEDVLKRIESGESFTKIATDRDPANKGDLGYWLLKEDKVLPDEIYTAVAQLKPGEHTGVVRTPRLTAIFRCEDIKPGSQVTFDVVQSLIKRRILAQKRAKALKAYATDLRNQSKIEVYKEAIDDNLNKVLALLTKGDCGNKAIVTLLTQQGVKFDKEDKIRMADIRLSSAGRGLSLWDLAELAQTKGFKATGMRVTYDHLQNMNSPVIAHVNGNHFMLVEKAGDEFVEEWDACSNGKKLLEVEEFKKIWNGVILVLSKQDAGKKVTNGGGAQNEQYKG